MDFEVSQHGEALPALPAAERFQPAVEALVSQAVVLPGELLPADAAAERPLPRVDPLVRLQPGLLCERLPTLEAPERFGGLVGALVLLQLRQAEETLVAHRADVDALIPSPHGHKPFWSAVHFPVDNLFI